MSSFAPDDVTHKVPGLAGRVEILVDRWGIPHLYAASPNDAFFAQGFNAARERLWQIDLWRRRGLGLLSEVLGPAFVEKDRAARLFLYRGETQGGMRAEWLAYGSDTKRVATAFAAGINAYVRLTEEDPELLPEEFRILGYRPSRWSPEDVTQIRGHGLFANIEEEVARAVTLREFGAETEALRRRLEPPREVSVPEGLDLSVLSDDVLAVYRLAREPVDFGEVASSPVEPQAKPWGEPEGSNNWVISPERTATGRPILANDPHRTQSVPSLRYAVHLSAPGMDVIGAGEPALPGISIGHNGHIAFGLTIFSIDQEDLYVYETNPENPDEYRYKGRWEPMTIERQSVPVKNAEPVEVTLRFTRHGPVIHEEPEKNVAFAVRAAWLEAGMAPYLGSIDYMRAKDWDGFLAAMNRWGAPGENQVYADAEGNIGWKPAGLVPRRPNWDGLLPVPGDGRYEWDGFLDADELPAGFNPPRGFISTANEMNLPDEHPHEEKRVSHEWYAPFRQDRISEVLAAGSAFTAKDAVDLQTDYLSVPARRICARLAGLTSEDPKTQEALALLGGWDHVLDASSAAAALFEVYYRRHLRPALLRQRLAEIVPEGSVEAAVDAVLPDEEQTGDARTVLDLVESRDAGVGGLMVSTLGGAYAELERLLGPDPARWKWGDLHHAYLAHPLSPLVDGETRGRLSVGPAPRGGSGDTVGNTAYRLGDFRQTGGSSWRLAVDVGGWDGSLFMNAPGQSGNPSSRHYGDLFPAWAGDRAFPLLYSREKVEEATERRIILEPEKSPTSP